MVIKQNQLLGEEKCVNKTKTLLSKSLTQSVMLYGAEVWMLGTHQENKLFSAEMEQSSKEMKKGENQKS